MDPQDIMNFAKLLRDNGDKVLNADFKLTLSVRMLQALNDSFGLIIDTNEICQPLTFQVVKPNNLKSDVYRDLQFIYDFVQKAEAVCIRHLLNDEPYVDFVDITKFRNLKRLEIIRIDIHKVLGIQQMRAHLIEIICNKSVEEITDIITHCGGDNSNGFIWNELKCANFSYNSLKHIDSSLEFAPYLQMLNLSHNQLVSVEAVKWLPNLKVLDISYNRLTHIPRFNLEAPRRLQILRLSNNYIEDVHGVNRLDALTNLDLTGNNLLDHSCLLPLSTLIALSNLCLDGNPLACHPKHREATASYLHKNTQSVKFVFDGIPLSKAERLATGKYHSYNAILSTRLGTGRSSGLVTPSRRSTDNTPTSSLGSVRHVDSQNDMTSSICSTGGKRLKIRNARISDLDDLEKQPEEDKTKKIIEGNKDHLETKKQIQNLRNKFGDEWLHRQGGQEVQTVLGVNVNKLNTTKSIAEQMIDVMLHGGNELESPIIENQSGFVGSVSTPTSLKGGVYPNNPSESPIPKTIDNDDNKKNKSNDTNQDADAFTSAQSETSSLANIYKTAVEDQQISSDDDNNDDMTYICVNEVTKEEVFVIISETHIKEKDAMTGRTKLKWSLNSLESCDILRTDVIRLRFDTIRKDKKERIYNVETGAGQKLVSYLRGILSKRTLSEMNQTIYKCANCTTQFCRENNRLNRGKAPTCPKCESGYLIELQESPPKPNSPKQNMFSVFIDSSKSAKEEQDSPPHSSSVESATSANDSSSCSRISNSNSSFDSNKSIAGSPASGKLSDIKSLKNGESDIEILSNPSQSSIEVLESESRKQSEERTDIDTVLFNIGEGPLVRNQESQSTGTSTTVDAAIVNTAANGKGTKKGVLSGLGLTESSSSGSVTDSICTAYEKQLVDSPSKTSLEIVAKPASSDNLMMSMLGGLFQSTNLLMTRNVVKSQQSLCDEFKFSYVDFTKVDHRLKAYLYQNVFEVDSEHMKWLTRAQILDETQINNQSPGAEFRGFDGIFVVSTSKFYVLQITGPESDNCGSWLKRLVSGSVQRITNGQVLPWKIGVALTVKDHGTINLILKDIMKTDGLLHFIQGGELPESFTLDYQMSDILSQRLAAIDEKIKMLTILPKVSVTNDGVVNDYIMRTLIVTEKKIYLSTMDFGWLFIKVDRPLRFSETQEMSNLIEAERVSERAFSLNFMNEMGDKFYLWKCTFDSSDSAMSTFDAIDSVWSVLFGMPLIFNNDDTHK